MMVDLLRAHGTTHQYKKHGCRCDLCRSAWSENRRDYYQRNRETLRARHNAKNALRRDEEAQRVREYYREHPERKQAVDRRYRETHREARRASHRRRKSRLRGSSGSHTGEQVLAQMQRQKARCYWCGKKLVAGYHVDHVTPVCLGGSNGIENLVISCPACNMRKHQAHPMDFAGVML